MHTLGVGNGCDTNLITRCAFVGLGNHCFIQNMNEVDSKVIETLSKTQLEYLLIEDARILNAKGETIHQMEKPAPLFAGSLWNY